jgi:L-fuconolactonase
MVTEADWLHWKPNDFRPYFDIIFEAFGTERIMIGSDWPVCTLAGNYHEVIGLVKNYLLQLSPGKQEMLLGTNATRAYSLLMQSN